jgi:predicted DNA-binding transcriptional regulator YafY
MKLNGTLKALICEIASIDSVQSAVNNRNVAIINYDGDEPGGKGIREIEPVALGKSKAGNLVLRAWDREGSSHTAYKGEQPLPGWRLFRLDKILSFKPTGEIYNEVRPGYNLNGDRSMISVITIAKFDNTPTPNPTTPPQQNV